MLSDAAMSQYPTTPHDKPLIYRASSCSQASGTSLGTPLARPASSFLAPRPHADDAKIEMEISRQLSCATVTSAREQASKSAGLELRTSMTPWTALMKDRPMISLKPSPLIEQVISPSSPAGVAPVDDVSQLTSAAPDLPPAAYDLDPWTSASHSSALHGKALSPLPKLPRSRSELAVNVNVAAIPRRLPPLFASRIQAYDLHPSMTYGLEPYGSQQASAIDAPPFSLAPLAQLEARAHIYAGAGLASSHCGFSNLSSSRTPSDVADPQSFVNTEVGSSRRSRQFFGQDQDTFFSPSYASFPFFSPANALPRPESSLGSDSTGSPAPSSTSTGSDNSFTLSVSSENYSDSNDGEHENENGKREDINRSSSASRSPTKTTRKRRCDAAGENGQPVDAARRSHACSECNRSFARPSALQTHMRSHSKEKPFTCPVTECQRSFSVFSNLKRHAKLHKEVDFSKVSLHDYDKLALSDVLLPTASISKHATVSSPPASESVKDA